MVSMLSFLSHIGVVVRDADKTAEFLTSLGLGPWQTFDYSQSKEQVITGAPFHLRIIWARLWRQAVLELIQPLDNESLWAKFLETKGEGVHHIAFSVSNWDEMVSKLKKQGNKMIVGGTNDGKRWCYFETKPGGIIIEPMENGLHEVSFPNTR